MPAVAKLNLSLFLSSILLFSVLAFSPLASFAQTSVPVSIVQGSQTLTTDAYSPNPVEISVGDTVIWTNDDSTLHTATSGTPSDGSTGMFGGTAGSPGNPVYLAPGQTQEFTFTEAGEFPYYCTLHPNMVGTVVVGQSAPAPVPDAAEQAAGANATAASPELAETPFYKEHVTVTGQSQINATHLQVSLAGNGTIMLPNSTDAINVSSAGSALINFATSSLAGQEVITTGDGGENATASFYQITRRDNGTGMENGLVIAIFHTNSTGALAPLNGMIGVGPSTAQPNGDTDLALFEWKSDTPLPTNSTARAISG